MLVMDLQVLHTAPPDGPLRYRVDSTGTQVAILPARCKLGLHVLAPAECRVIVQEGEVHLSCPACAANGAAHCWRLTTSRPSPDRAELDDDAYRDLMPRRSTPATH